MTASFPSSVKDFSDKEDGKKIYAAHVNELQDEVEAIETALLDGTEGQVLTAGSGGVPEWAAASGGGASFLFDNVVFTLGDYVENGGSRDVTIELTLGGNSITSGIVHTMLILTTDTNFDNDTNEYFWSDLDFNAFGGHTQSTAYENWKLLVFIPSTDGKCEAKFVISSNGSVEPFSFYMSAMLPNGGIASSSLITIPAAEL